MQLTILCYNSLCYNKYSSIKKIAMRNYTMNFDIDKLDRDPKMKLIGKKVGIWVIEILFVILLAYLFVNYGVQRLNMVGESMTPTLEEDAPVIINKMIYHIKAPKRFDVIAFRQNGNEHNYCSLRRIIGLPNETIQIKDGKIYIDGKEIEEKIQVEPMVSGGLASEPLKLDEDEYFVLGDNRNNSQDSRFASIGVIVKDNIVGKAWIRLNPFGFVSALNQVIDEPTESSEEK